MKRYIYTILAALTLRAAMSTFHSCKKPVEIDITPIDNGKTGNNNGQNTNPPAGQTPADVTLLIEAGKACEFNGYTSTAEAAVFYFDTNKDDWKEKWLKEQCEELFNVVLPYSPYLSPEMEKNPFTHPLYLLRYGRRKQKCEDIITSFRSLFHFNIDE